MEWFNDFCGRQYQWGDVTFKLAMTGYYNRDRINQQTDYHSMFDYLITPLEASHGIS